ncbi:MAG: WecB/TagA/CpsF family glycosyltransferase [Erysipelotrichaceae bacterium]|nr:WecB/TagA/CpsF family glycosyltransferase [Erysipelotrichaceae bacterium]
MKELFEKLYKQSDTEFYHLLKDHLLKNIKTFVITANPEIFMKSNEIPFFKKVLYRDSTIIIPDGEGIVMGARKLGYDVWGKIAGVDTVAYLFDLGNQRGASLYVYGASQEVLDLLREFLYLNYPNLQIYGLKNGYSSDEREVINDMLLKGADINLFALGVPRQEELITRYFDQFNHGIFVGCGGSLDVLSGKKRRAPDIIIRFKLEWAYRLFKEPKRIQRFYDSNVKFLYKVMMMKKEKQQ